MKLGVSQSYLSVEWPLVKFLLWALLLFVQIHEHRACIEDERMGLLELKAFLKSKTNHTEPLLPTWVNDTKSECCSWEQVKCNTTTGHVIKLMLSSINQEQNYEDTWYINMSLFQPFKELRNLDLSYNKIAGWLGNEGMWTFASTITHTHTCACTHTHTHTQELRAIYVLLRIIIGLMVTYQF